MEGQPLWGGGGEELGVGGDFLAEEMRTLAVGLAFVVGLWPDRAAGRKQWASWSIRARSL